MAGLLFVVLLSTSTISEAAMKENDHRPDKLSQEEVAAADWTGSLTPEQHRILREAGTEAPGGEVYKQFKEQGAGTYFCAGCGAELFHAEQKFDARCGWPSFWNPADIDAIKEKEDRSLGMVRTEVLCANCDGHLGHLFEGEGFSTPTDKRYCINGTVLVFVPDDDDQKP